MRPIGVTYPPLANLRADFINRIRRFSNVLDIKNGHAFFVYNLLGMTEFTSTAKGAISPGKHQIRAEFAYDGGRTRQGRHRHRLL